MALKLTDIDDYFEKEEPVEERRERATRTYEEEEPVSPIFERRTRPAAPVRERVRESDEPYQPERRPQPRRPRVYQDDYQENGRTQSRRGFTPDVPSFMKKKSDK